MITTQASVNLLVIFPKKSSKLSFCVSGCVLGRLDDRIHLLQFSWLTEIFCWWVQKFKQNQSVPIFSSPNVAKVVLDTCESLRYLFYTIKIVSTAKSTNAHFACLIRQSTFQIECLNFVSYAFVTIPRSYEWPQTLPGSILSLDFVLVHTGPLTVVWNDSTFNE